jgi:hypothetical protein
MSDRYKGALLSGTAPTVTLQSAGGEYTLSQQMQYQGQGIWPTAAQTPILQSLRFRSSASATLSRTPASATNRKTWTFSAWVKRGKLASINTILNAGYSTVSWFVFNFGSDDTLQIAQTAGSSPSWKTAAVFRDPSAWYHVVCVVDTTSATSTMNGSSTDRFRLYVNSVQYVMTSGTIPSQNSDLQVNNTISHTIGGYSSEYYDGEIAEVNFIDGIALTPSSFGTTDANGIWQPIPYTGTYGTNGYYLKFNNTTSTATLGNDSSGNSNTWTVNNISLTSGSTYDSMLDSPSNASSTIANYCVLSPIDTYDNPPTQGNLTRIGVGHTGSPWSTCRATVGASSGKWYFEATLTGSTGSTGNNMVGVMTTTTSTLSDAYGGSTTRSYQANGNLQGDGSTGTVASAVSGDVIMIAYDIDASKMWVGKNGTWQNSGNPVTGAGPVFTYLPTSPIVPQVSMYGNTGDNYGWYTNFGQQPFTYTPPTGFNRLNTYNLPVPTIPAGNKFMDAQLYTGNGTSQTLTTASGFKPDLVWIKQRGAATGNDLTDTVRGATITLQSQDTAGDETRVNDLTAFTSTGFSVGSGGNVNTNAGTYVAWEWQAGQGVTSSNTNGTITSTVSVNTTAGFSVVTFTAGSGNQTVGHGLGVAPSMVILKRRNSTSAWLVYHSALSSPATSFLELNTGAAVQSASPFWGASGVTSTTFGTSDNATINGATYVAYCFAPVAGFSAFGSYTGTFTTDGPFVYTGFRPKFVMLKASGDTGNWNIIDSTRNTSNVENARLFPSLANAENTATVADFLANGFKIRSSDSDFNYTVQNIYIAFAENPFKMARAR